MSSPAEDLSAVLIAAGLGTFNATTGWSVAIGKEPTDPDTTITLYDIGGLTPDPKWLLDYPSVQIRVRGEVSGYQAAWARMRQVRDELLGADPFTQSGNSYRSLLLTGEAVHIGYDSHNRPMFTMTFSLIVEPAATAETNREAIT